MSDPEGNRIECYTPTPWHVQQPTWWPLDLLTERMEDIRARTETLAKSAPGFMLREDWKAHMTQRIAQARQRASWPLPLGAA